MPRPFERVAIVNRGEAATRFVHAAHELTAEGTVTRAIALYTDPDRQARFVRDADESYALGCATFEDEHDGCRKPAYLDLTRVERALRETGAEAAWVGWGFVAEQPEFAEMCARLGVVFIGPDAGVMRLLGDKIASKRLAEQVDIPVVPWSGGPVSTLEAARDAASALGYPVLVKASAGGGGRGIRVVPHEAALADALARAQAEAQRAFGDATVYLERQLEGARHVEVQVAGDDAGRVLALGVRDCTVQRRSQKVMEEAPSPVLPPGTGAALLDAAVRLARAARYRNLGTVEFLYDVGSDRFWFMEVNARLQVEHPVTELTTGLDLVKWQVRLARGELLPVAPPPVRGHAIEVRINAEDPGNGFTPASGRVEMLRLPTGPGLRVDAGVAEGDLVPAEFDSMIAKIIAWGADRREALARLRRGLAETKVVVRGGATNKAFLLTLVDRPELRDGQYTVGWLDDLVARNETAAGRDADVALLRAAVEAYEAELDVERAQFFASAARGRPESRPDVGRVVELGFAGAAYRLNVCRVGPRDYRIQSNGSVVRVRAQCLGSAPLRERRARGAEWRLTVGVREFRVLLAVQGLRYMVEVDGHTYYISRDQAGIVRSLGPALVVSVMAREGDTVEAGDRLVLLEAMKMEVTVTAPCAGRIREVAVAAGVQVGAGIPLVVVEPADAERPAVEAPRLSFARLEQASDRASKAPADHCGLDDLRALVLGYDIDATAARAAIDAWCSAPYSDDVASACLAGECDLVAAFVDITDLLRPVPPRHEASNQARVSAEEYLFTYLRDLDASGDRLPPAYANRLLRALALYGVSTLATTEALKEALFRIFKAHQRFEQRSTAIQAILSHRLDMPDRAVAGLGDRFRSVLDRLVGATEHRAHALHDLAREVRYRAFEQPLLDEARAVVYDEARRTLDRLLVARSPDERETLIADLIACPQPLATFLMSRFARADPDQRQTMLEVLERRYYRIRNLRAVRGREVEGRAFLTLEYEHEGRQVHVVSTHGDYADGAAVLGACRRAIDQVPPDHDVTLDVYLWRDGALGDADANERELHRLLEAATWSRPLRRAVMVVSGPQGGLGLAGMQHFTYRATPGGYEEEKFYRGAHPMMGKRLHLGRLANFEITRLPSPEDVYILHAVARDNPRDERLFAVAEVRDLTAVRDGSGDIVRLPQLERMLHETLAGMRRFQAHRPDDRRLHWNRVLLYLWPLFTLSPAELRAIVERLAPATEGLGIEELLLRVRLPRASGGPPVDRVIAITSPDTALSISYRDPPSGAMRTLSTYEQKVVRARQQGLLYPYELLKALAAPPGMPFRTPHVTLPPGVFFEYDLDEEHRLVPVRRPCGENGANIIVGLVTNFTRTHPDGLTRVALLGDPTRDLGSLAEPECRRIIAALDLAEEKRVPVEWFAISAGAKISMESGTENMDWIALVLRRIVDFTQRGGEINVVVCGINVGAQPYWNAEATMLMHTRGILVMTPQSSMVLTGKRALDYSGGVSAEDNQGIGGYQRVMGPNGQAQYFAADVYAAADILLRHYEYTYVAPEERSPRRAATADPADRDVCASPYSGEHGFTRIGDIFGAATNPGRKRPFDIRSVMSAVIDQDHAPLERWAGWRDAESTVAWEARLGGYPVALVGIESKPLSRLGFVPADGPEQWTAGTLFPQSSRKLARAINAASGNRPVVILANLSGFDGSPESLRHWQLEYGAEIGRAVVNFEGPMVFCVVSRYHGGAFVVFSNALNAHLEVAAVEGSYASVIGGAPAAAVVFAREVERRTADDPEVQSLERKVAAASGAERARLLARLATVSRAVHARKLGEVADEFDDIHSVERARRVGSVHHIIPAARLRPYLIDAVDRGIRRVTPRADRASAEPLLEAG